jgi:hypothetical protein
MFFDLEVGGQLPHYDSMARKLCYYYNDSTSMTLLHLLSFINFLFRRDMHTIGRLAQPTNGIYLLK